MNDYLKDALSMILTLALMGGIFALGLYTYRHYFNHPTNNNSSHTRSNSSYEDKSDEDDVYYENCTEAREDGAQSIREGEPGYREELDRDGDGIACEPWHGRQLTNYPCYATMQA